MSLAPEPGQDAWIVAVDMGLGHQRAAYPLKELGGGRIIDAGAAEYSSVEESKLWRRMRRIYEGVSRLTHIPIIGGFLFGMLDRFQEISPYYPFRDRSLPSLQAKYIDKLVRKGLCATMIEKMRPSRLPIISTFFTPGIAADLHRYDAPVYLVVTDTDINRAWVPVDSDRSKILYLAPCGHVVNRLKQYGVPDERILLTGFPLPKENLGGPDLDVLKLDLGQRLLHLDPQQRFWVLHRVEVEHYLTPANCVPLIERPLTLTFAVGGAGAQKEIGVEVLKSLKPKILAHQIKLNLVAGIRDEVRDYFEGEVNALGLEDELGLGVHVIHSPTKERYFQRFNLLLRSTDILWTKPSELSFYCALGLPIIIGPPLGAHEHFNKKWILNHHAGIAQEDPTLTAEWLFDYLNDGVLAQIAWDGFLDTRKCGTYKIEEIIRTGAMTRDPSPLKR